MRWMLFLAVSAMLFAAGDCAAAASEQAEAMRQVMESHAAAAGEGQAAGSCAATAAEQAAAVRQVVESRAAAATGQVTGSRAATAAGQTVAARQVVESHAAAAGEGQAASAGGAGSGQAAGDEDGLLDITEELEAYLDLDEIQSGFRELVGETEFSFSGTVLSLLRGELPFEPGRLPELLAELFLGELRQQKQMAVQILVVVLASAIFSNFVKVFDSSQIADISFFMMYLLISTLLMRSFLAMSQSVVRTCGWLNRFMRLLLPSYLVTVVLSSGTISAVGFYEITVFGMQLLQTLLIRAALPAIHFYLVLLLLNQMTAEEHFSRFAELVETVIQWVTKSIFGIVVGLQAVQVLVAPALDSLKNSALHRLARSIPGIGAMLDSAAETVVGSAVVIKNAVGVAGMLALVILGAAPVLKLLASILIFRLLCALIQPVSEKRMVEGIASISRGAVLLLRILATSISVFVISLAMITAAIRGG